MGTISARTGVALTVTALATSGFTLMAGPALADGRVATAICSYTVNAPSGLNVRKGPGTQFRIIIALQNGTHIRATCAATNGWVKIARPVTYKGKHIRGGWVFKNHLKSITANAPKGGVRTGGGGTSNDASALLPITGLGLVTLGSGVAIATLRRRTSGAVPSA